MLILSIAIAKIAHAMKLYAMPLIRAPMRVSWVVEEALTQLRITLLGNIGFGMKYVVVAKMRKNVRKNSAPFKTFSFYAF